MTLHSASKKRTQEEKNDGKSAKSLVKDNGKSANSLERPPCNDVHDVTTSKKRQTRIQMQRAQRQKQKRNKTKVSFTIPPQKMIRDRVDEVSQAKHYL